MSTPDTDSSDALVIQDFLSRHNFWFVVLGHQPQVSRILDHWYVFHCLLISYRNITDRQLQHDPCFISIIFRPENVPYMCPIDKLTPIVFICKDRDMAEDVALLQDELFQDSSTEYDWKGLITLIKDSTVVKKIDHIVRLGCRGTTVVRPWLFRPLTAIWVIFDWYVHAYLLQGP